jgi:SPP1 family predicted phage head-tail adaptor
MRAGELNRRITLQIETITYDTVNEPIETWTDFATVWASIITTGGREFYAAQKLNAETSAVFKIRYNPMVNPRMRISWGNRIFEIISVNDVDARHEELQISAKEVV